MAFKPPVPKEVKEEILKKVKEGRVSVLEAATQHGLSPRTIHDWLAHQITGDGLPQENARLKKENQELYELLGRVSAELERSKKRTAVARSVMDAVSASKVRLAKQLGVSRSSLYYHPKLPEKDLLLKEQIETVWKEYPSYVHKRLALELGVNKKRILRVMHQFQIKPYRRRVTPPVKKQDSHPEFAVFYPNLVQGLCPRVPHAVWVADFTYIRWRSGFIYLATVMDLFTREVLGWHVANHHQAYLVITAFTEAVAQAGTAPQILHSDQGSEYTCFSYGAQVLVAGTKLSYSKKSSPWQNGYQESFYSQFKLDLGDPQRFETLGELIAEIHTGIHRYNKLRIHTALKMPPRVFAERFHAQREKQRVCEKMGT